MIPLRKPSHLDQRLTTQFLLAASDGLTGEVSRLLNTAAELAIRDRSECINLGHLEHVVKRADA